MSASGTSIGSSFKSAGRHLEEAQRCSPAASSTAKEAARSLRQLATRSTAPIEFTEQLLQRPPDHSARDDFPSTALLSISYRAAGLLPSLVVWLLAPPRSVPDARLATAGPPFPPRPRPCPTRRKRVQLR